MLDDSGEEIDQELLGYFLDESFEVVQRLNLFLQSFTDTSNNAHFESFGQQIDRIMGAAYTLSLNEVGDLAKYGKELGYKSSQVNDLPKLLSIQSLLSQLVKAMENILKGIKKGHRHDKEEVKPLIHRLSAASTQLGNLRASVK